jgi:hypothetical protein
MSHNNVTTWTCDRCGRQADVERADTAPPGWHLITAQTFSKDDQRNYEVCGGCFSQVERMLMNQRDVVAA